MSYEILNEDALRDFYDYSATHNDPHSPYYDGDDSEVCPACGASCQPCDCDAQPEGE